MKTFKDLEFRPHRDVDGIQSVMMFDNGYGVSVIKTPFSYGGKMGLYELAVLDSGEDITYNTPVTNDVLGHLSEEEVTKYMIEVQKLLTFNLK
jgi:hydroxylamine reductase (hybrid-cluster protein)